MARSAARYSPARAFSFLRRACSWAFLNFYEGFTCILSLDEVKSLQVPQKPVPQLRRPKSGNCPSMVECARFPGEMFWVGFSTTCSAPGTRHGSPLFGG
jgi:hypothetical protein